MQSPLDKIPILNNSDTYVERPIPLILKASHKGDTNVSRG